MSALAATLTDGRNYGLEDWMTTAALAMTSW
jgi:hypothetical protein